MIVLKARNPQNALPLAIDLLKKHAVRRESRNGPVLFVPEPVTIHYTHPQERVMFWPERDANPFFHLFESMHYLAGRNTITPLVRYAKQIAAYSDDGITMHSAYGHRWRSHFGFDQLPIIAKQLRENPDDRRCVLQIWDVNDLGKQGRDFACLSGDTLIWSPEGDKPIAELAAKFQDGSIIRWPVYSVDPESKKMHLTWATNFWQSGIKPVKRIIFDDGTDLKITTDHLLYQIPKGSGNQYQPPMIRTGAIDAIPIAASMIGIGDRLLAARRFYDEKGAENFKRELGDNTNFGNMIDTHREYAELLWGAIPYNFDVHHINEINTDNRSENLQVLSHGDHSSLHRSGDNNPMRKMSPEKRAIKGKHHSETMKALWAEGWYDNKNLTDSHKVIAIEECGSEPVFDFTTTPHHTALVGSGIVAHNCNVTSVFSRNIDGSLDMSVFQRSGDAIWGVLGANCVHFSFLHEYLALWIGCQVGAYHQITTNFHAYLDTFEKVQSLAEDDITTLNSLNPYHNREVSVVPLRGHIEAVNEHIHSILHEADTGFVKLRYYSDPWAQLAYSVLRAHHLWKSDGKQTAIDSLRDYDGTDWGRAAVEWLGRRADKK